MNLKLKTSYGLFILALLLVIGMIYFSSPDPKPAEIEIENTATSTEEDVVSSEPQISEYQLKLQLEEKQFKDSMTAVASDHKWSELVAVYQGGCDIIPGSVLNSNSLLFPKFIQSIVPIKFLPNGSRVLIVPCMLHAYQTSQIVVIDNGVKYIPVEVRRLDDPIVSRSDYAQVEINYDPVEDVFESFGKLRGLGDCWFSSKYRLIANYLVLIEERADRECDGIYGEGETIYQLDQAP